MDIHQLIIAAAEAAQEVVSEAAQGAAAETTEHASGGPLGTFGVNWKLFVAQLINFGVVLFIFWKWVVKPLGRALEARQEKIESGLKSAEIMEQERKNFEEEKSLEMKKARQEAEQIIKNAQNAADKAKNDTIAAASAQAEKMLEQTKATLEQEKQKMLQEVRGEAANLVAAAAEHILKEKIDPAKDKQLIEDGLNKAAQA